MSTEVQGAQRNEGQIEGPQANLSTKKFCKKRKEPCAGSGQVLLQCFGCSFEEVKGRRFE